MITLYYFLTAHFPRKTPKNMAQFTRFWTVLTRHFGVTDTPENLGIAAGRLSSAEPRKSRTSWGAIANVIKHMQVISLAKQIQLETKNPAEERLKATALRQQELCEAVCIIFEENPEEFQQVLGNNDEITRSIAMRAMKQFPSEGNLNDWMSFIKGIALQENADRATNSDPKSEPASVH